LRPPLVFHSLFRRLGSSFHDVSYHLTFYGPCTPWSASCSALRVFSGVTLSATYGFSLLGVWPLLACSLPFFLFTPHLPSLGLLRPRTVVSTPALYLVFPELLTLLFPCAGISIPSFSAINFFYFFPLSVFPFLFSTLPSRWISRPQPPTFFLQPRWPPRVSVWI